jgi:hypothetical protein
VADGIRLVEEGDYDLAIVTLDRAVQRLTEDPEQTRVLSYAYLYLGIAYLGKGHEAAAKAKFKEAIAQIKDMTLSPEDYPPKVIDLFEAAREDARESAPDIEGEAPVEKKGGSNKTLILLGAGGAAAAGLAVAMSGGSDSEPEPFEPPPAPLKTDLFPGILTHDEDYVEILVGPGANGPWEAQISWTNPQAQGFWMDVKTESWDYVVEAQPVGPNSLIARWEGEGRFRIEFGFDSDHEFAPGNYELRVTYPPP